MRVVLVLLSVAACWLAREPRIEPSNNPRPELAVITGLPLFWKESAAGVPTPSDAPIISVLRQRFDVRPVDSPLSLGTAKRLLLAHPRALAPEEKMTLDSWVRQGGEALVLADPELRWPMELPWGDRRRPPPTALLAGLIEHWGVHLGPTLTGGEYRHFLGDGRLLTIYAGSNLIAPNQDCQVDGGGLVARCKVGNGGVTIVGDADLIDDRLWLADPDAPLDPRQWTANTPQFIAQAVGADLPTLASWVKSGPKLAAGLRWALLVGIFWAGLGSALFCRADRAGFRRLSASSEPRMSGKQ